MPEPTAWNRNTFRKRYSLMGDISEDRFGIYCILNGIKNIRFGFNRPDFAKFYNLPLALKHMPDRLIEVGNDHYFVEVKGCGQDALIKIKKEDLTALGFWNNLLPVNFAVYDSSLNSLHYGTTLEEVEKMKTECEVKQFDDNRKEYYLFKKEMFREWIV